MNKNGFILLSLLALCLWGCSEKTKDIEIQGEIKGLEDGSVYLFGQNELGELNDTIRVEEGKFSAIVKVDTLTLGMLLFENNLYPIYIDKGNKIRIKGDMENPGRLEVSGNEWNNQLTAFYQDIPPEHTDSLMKAKVEDFIREYPASYAIIYLIDKYYIQAENPDIPATKPLIELMDGNVRDKAYIEQLGKYLETYEKATVGRIAPSFSLTDSEGNRISRYDFRNKYILLNFWASWCDSCKTVNRELRRVYDKFRKDERFVMIGISLDTDKQVWLDAIKDDTLKWKQGNELLGWESNAANSFAITDIPYNILIAEDGKIMTRGITIEELTNKLDSLPEKKNH